MLPRPERIVERSPLVQDPPFSLAGVRALLFVVPCDGAAVAALLRRTFGWAQPEWTVRSLAPAALIVVMDVPRAEASDPTLGWFAYQEASVFLPVVVERRGEGPSLALHVPFIYPSEGLAVAAGREVYGLPKKPARLRVPGDEDFWGAGAPATVDVLAAERFDGSQWQDRTLLRVIAAPHALDASAANALLAAVDAHCGPLPPGLAGHWLHQDLVQLKQVADVTTGGLPPRALYRAITRVKAPVRALSDVRVGDARKVRFEVAPLASEPMAAALGLAPSFSPLFAARLTMSFGFDAGVVLREEPSSGTLPPRKTRVLVLGGGMGALAAAHALTDTEERRARFDVRVLAQGHLLGGKGASHRNAAPGLGARSEEHGLHVFFGFYHNALRLMRSVYDEASRRPDAKPSTFAEAFEPSWDVTFHDGHSAFDVTFPRTGDGFGAAPRAVSDQLEVLKTLLGDVFGGKLFDLVAGGLFPALSNPVARQVLAFAATLFTGVLADVVVEGRSFDDLDRYDFREWMARHHIPGFPDLGSTAIMQVPYDGVFAYEGADTSRPRLGAGLAARGLLQLVADYEVAPCFIFRAGMGECVFAPLYEVLRARGVKFELFAKVEEVAIEGSRVARVRYARQANVAAGPFAYEPLARAGDVVAWRDPPDLGQLAPPAPPLGSDLYSDAIDLHAGDDPVLRVGDDFDVVVCALPAPVTARVLRGHEGHDALARIAKIPTVATLHTQLWFAEPTPALGWTWRAGVLGGFPQPLNSMHLRDPALAVEQWPSPDPPRGLLYLSGPFGAGWTADSTDPAARARADEDARAAATAFVRTELWKALPRAAVGSPPVFDFGVLYEPGGAPPVMPLAGQYVRANIDLSARYVLCVPGGLADRPRPVVIGLDNLLLAGDWTHNGVDIPCIEATVVSALQAAEAITGEKLGILA